ncbi:MAG TPA: type II toxin-antitoxin system VapC family toxin [Thermoanaerobaculia bacterium]|nr:type II toxin-antitoxin system VapC family toxin [Thermoanaerobaculia bacterium]
MKLCVRRDHCVEAGAILRAFGALPIELRPSSALLTPAFEVAVALDRSVYDCLYLSLAVAEECALRRDAGVDDELHPRRRSSAIRIVLSEC